MKRERAETQGRKAERYAAWWLRLQGWRILGTRVRTPRGEIDLVARRFGTVAFVEVKWRQSGAARDIAIDEYRLRRVAAAVEAVSHRFARPSDDLRIDVLLLAPRSLPRHMPNVWQP